MKPEASAILFNEGELIGFKGSTFDYRPTPNEMQFFCLNPLLTFNNLKKDNLSARRNMLLEFDKCSFKKQDKIVGEAALPWSVKTFSGNKSYHFVIALEDSIEEEQYKEIAAILFTRFPQADSQCRNSNRLSRTPGVLRDNNIEQKLVGVNRRVSLDELWNWIKVKQGPSYLNYLAKKQWALEQSVRFKKVAADVGDNYLEMLAQYRPSWERELASDKVIPGDRHRRAMGLARAMYICGMPIEEVEGRITEFLISNGKGAALAEAYGITSWVERIVVPLVFDEEGEFYGNE